MTLKAVVGGTLIDGTGAAPIANAVVLVDDDRIRSAAPAAETAIPDEADVLDMTGRYIIPGLMDANVHLFNCVAPELLLEYEGRYSCLIEEACQVTLRSGVTTVFDTMGPLEPLTAVRERIDRGEIVGSRMFVAGHIIGLGGPWGMDMFPPGGVFGPDTVERINSQFEQRVGPDLLWLTPEGVRQRVRDYLERSNVDFVKYGASGHGMKFSSYITFSELAQRAIVEEAHRVGLTVQAHTMTAESLRMEIEAGADILQHGNITGPEPIPEGVLNTIVDRALPVAALVYTDKNLAWCQEHLPEWYFTFAKMIDRNNRRLIEAGARMLLTTDGSVYGPRLRSNPAGGLIRADDCALELGESHFLWLAAAIDRGMSPMDALLAATRNIAEAYGKSAEIGTLQPGKRADLVVLEANPLDNVQNYRRIVEVMKDGVVVDREALPNHRLLSAPAAPAAVAAARPATTKGDR